MKRKKHKKINKSLSDYVYEIGTQVLIISVGFNIYGIWIFNLELFRILINLFSIKTNEFIYNGIEYDTTDYIFKHPGGRGIIDDMKTQRRDITQYFKSLHSEDAQKILKSFPIVSVGEPSKDSKQYMTVLSKVQHLYEVRWTIEILLMIFLGSTFLVGCFTRYWLVSIVCLAYSQAVVGWMGHSMGHSRNFKLMKCGSYFISLFGGFYMNWWAPKHNVHHMFTNSKLHDDDIKHDYKVYLYPFLYLKWRWDSIVKSIKDKNSFQFSLLLINYSIIFYCHHNLINFIIAELLIGLYSAFLLIGNHQRESLYHEEIKVSFIDHQISACRNYFQSSFFWVLIMGGMQFQAQHHMFPQIPFYSLPRAVPIIRQQLKKLNKSIKYGPVL